MSRPGRGCSSTSITSRNYAPASQLEILAHELIHAFTRDESGPKLPSWIEEGLANFGGGNGGRALRIPPRTELRTTSRPTTSSSPGRSRDIQTVYDQGQLAIQVLDEKFGRAGLVKFYEELGSRRVVAGDRGVPRPRRAPKERRLVVRRVARGLASAHCATPR